MTMTTKNRCNILALLALTTALAGCGNPGNPAGGSQEDLPLQTAHVEGIRPAQTRDPDQTFEFPTDPAKTTEPAQPSDGLLTLTGTVVEQVATETMGNVFAVKVWHGGEEQIYLLFVWDDVEFCAGDQVFFTYDSASKPLYPFDGEPVWEALDIGFLEVAVPEKPVIYLYPETATEVSVRLTLDGRLTCTYPAYENGWNDFTAYPDGTLIGPDGKEYYCLYWEGIQNTEYDFTQGFCVKGSETAAFLEWALAEQGLTPREANEFIIYWLPRMESNPYNVISFQTTAYTDGAVLEVTPVPDTLLRVFMAWYPSDLPVAMVEQAFEPVERDGFTVVEWGGSEAGDCE